MLLHHAKGHNLGPPVSDRRPLFCRRSAGMMEAGSDMTETKARKLLRNWSGLGRLEAWAAEQEWEATPSGWAVLGTLQGWHFRIEVIADGIRLKAGEPGAGQPALWTLIG
jgi:hypothetical protein